MSSALGENVRTQNPRLVARARTGVTAPTGSGADCWATPCIRAAPARSRRTTLGARSALGKRRQARPSPPGSPSSLVVIHADQAQPLGWGDDTADRDRSPLCNSQLTSDARRRPRPTSTSAPTTERTIWWQNEVAEMSNRSSRAPGPSSPARTGRSERRASSTRRRMGVAGLGPRDPPAEGPKVVLTEQRVGGAGHGPEVERPRDVPRHRSEQWVRGLVLEDQVPVVPGPGRAAGVEPGRGHLGGPHDDGGLEQGVDRSDQAAPCRRRRARRHGPPDPGRAPRRRSAPHRPVRRCGRPPRRWRRPGPRPRSVDRVGRRSPGIPPRRKRSSTAGEWSPRGARWRAGVCRRGG